MTVPDQVRCPMCGGQTWDNRLTKRSPKAPDYRCKDCKAAGWLNDTGGWRWAPPLHQKRD